jgi:uncharacterized cupin superfamily protein
MPSTKMASLSDVPKAQGVAAGYLKRELFEGRIKQRLAKDLGLTQFGVNYTMLEPGAYSALRHWHEGEDEFIFVLEGELTLIDDNGRHALGPGNFCAFPAGESNAHHIANLGADTGAFFEIGSRRPGQDIVHYPDDDFGPIQR